MSTVQVENSTNIPKLIDITDKALEQVKVLLSKEENPEQKGLRLGVVGGGCSGFSYKIEFSNAREKDNVIDFNGVKVFVDLKSSIYLKGITLDFKDGLSGKGFVFINPNATNTCGCGESFSV
jgi:iron-sulfur cluster assembly protein